MIGKTILHYEILEKLGEGGMGVVFKAQDTRLNREVAIKFLPRDAAPGSEERERFRIEAQSAAVLNHNNIATTYAIEEAADETFIVMEYIKGRELKAILDSKPMPIDQVLVVITQIVEGLQAAHEEGVIHRDIKSSNIMLTPREVVKIMDFGLAKRGGQTQLTKEGTTLGTVAYMSPEQTRGDGVDARSDIFSLGVLLYEMLTGQMPFKGDYDQAITYSILNEEPEPVTGLRSGIPMDLERIVNKCLKKDAAERYQRVDELLVDLKEVKSRYDPTSERSASVRMTNQDQERGLRGLWLIVATAIVVVVGLLGWWVFGSESSPETTAMSQSLARANKSIAVIPFRDMSPDRSQAWFGEGLAEEILGALTRIPGLRVIARQSSFALAEATISEINSQLGVSHVLSGSVLSEGVRARIRAQLTEVRTQEVIWSRDFQPELTSILDTQEEIARAVVEAMRVEVGAIGGVRFMPASTTNPLAHESYLRGLQLWNRRSEPDILSAIDHFQQAVRRDSLYAAAWAGLAYSYLVLPEYSPTADVNSVRAQSAAAASRALEIEPDQPDALTAMGWGLMIHHYDWQQAEKLIAQALTLDSTNVNALHWQSHVLSWQGRHDEALILARKAVTIDPLSSIIRQNYAFILMEARRFDNALQEIERVIAAEPGFSISYRLVWNINTRIGRFDVAAQALRNWLTKTGRDAIAAADLSREFVKLARLAAAGNPSGPLSKSLMDKLQPGVEVSGQLYAAVGDRENALDLLEQAERERAGARNLLSIKVNPLFDFIRDEPRFQDLMQRIGLKQ